jgi:hypothetical protein
MSATVTLIGVPQRPHFGGVGELFRLDIAKCEVLLNVRFAIENLANISDGLKMLFPRSSRTYGAVILIILAADSEISPP